MSNPFEQKKREELLIQIGHNCPIDVLEKLAKLSSNPKAIKKLQTVKESTLNMFLG